MLNRDRQFMRDITRRNELVWREVMAGFRELREESREHRREDSAQLRELTEEIRDLRRESIAQREGLFRLIDEINRLTGGQGPATA